MWLWGLLAIPLVWILYFLFYTSNGPSQQLEKFIDSHLLPYLLIKNDEKKHSVWKFLFLWSLVWSLLIFAVAGPRWNFREIDASSKDQSLVILLDLSESMNATDVKPSRLIRAKQKIEDLLNSSQAVKVGLVAFAADPHMIAPITEDKETIRYLLPSVDTDLVYVQGSKLAGALEMAETMLKAEPGSNKALLIVSDGDFEDSSAIAEVKKLAGKGIIIHVLGIGTAEGAVLQDKQGNILKKSGNPVISKLAKNALEELSKVGNGNYLEGKYGEEEMILQQLANRADSLVASQKKQIWDEHFYLLVLPALPIILWWFRRGTLFAFILLLLTPHFSLQAGFKEDYFMNGEERGKVAFDNGEYEAAENAFQDPYRRGVAYYKSGNYPEAEKMFRESSRPEVAVAAEYNLGNALALQNKFKEAIAAYEAVLKEQPDHMRAKENLELLKKLMEQQQQQNDQSGDSDQKNDQNKDDKDQKQNNKKDQKDKNNQEKNQDNESPSEKQDQGSDEQDHQDDKHQDKDDHSDLEKDQKDGQNHENHDSQDPEQKEADAKEAEGQPEQTEQPEIEAAQEGNEKSQEDQEADFWLNRITNDPKNFLKNKFYIESKKSGTTEGINPW